MSEPNSTPEYCVKEINYCSICRKEIDTRYNECGYCMREELLENYGPEFSDYSTEV